MSVLSRSRPLTPVPESSSLHDFPDELHRKVDPSLVRALEVVQAQNKKKLICRRQATNAKHFQFDESDKVQEFEVTLSMFLESPHNNSPPKKEAGASVYAIHTGSYDINVKTPTANKLNLAALNLLEIEEAEVSAQPIVLIEEVDEDDDNFKKEL
jgi:hypothetical protein